MCKYLRASSIRSVIVLIVVLSFCALATLPAAAETYFVNRGHVAASDANPGTEAAPWLTMNHAMKTALPGDVVVVRPGDYDERLLFHQTNNYVDAAEPTIFMADPPREATFWGADMRKAQGVHFYDFGVHYPKPHPLPGWVSKPAFIVGSDNVVLAANRILNIPGIAIEGYSAKPGDPYWAENVQIIGNDIFKVNMGIVIRGEGWRVIDNEIERLVRTENEDNLNEIDCDYIRFFGRNIVIRGNYLHGARAREVGEQSHVDGFQTFPIPGFRTEHVLIDGNIVESFDQGAMVGVNGCGGDCGINNITFTSNVFIGGEIGGAWGIQCIDVAQVIVWNNLFYEFSDVGAGFDGSGVYLRGTSNGMVVNNIFYNAGQNYWADDPSGLLGGYNLLNQRSATPNYYNEHDIVADPRFEAISSGEFTSDSGIGGAHWLLKSGYYLLHDPLALEVGVIQQSDLIGYDSLSAPLVDDSVSLQ